MTWAPLDDVPLDGSDRFDPWLRWSVATAFAGHPDLRHATDPVERVRAAAEFAPGKTDRGPLACAPNYAGQRYVTGEIQLADLPALAQLDGMLRFRLGSPSGGTAPAAPAGGAGPAPAAGPVVAVIDHGFAFANRAFRDDAGHSRVHALWDQSWDRTEPDNNRRGLWKSCDGFGYGGVLRHGEIDALIGSCPDETRLYAMAQYGPAQRRISHGTHVLDLAAGHPDPMPSAALPREQFVGWNVRDAAARAPILLVQLPAKPAKDTSGVSLCVHLLDALHWIVAQVGSQKVVVNLSDGAYAGPHDGTSLLESAIDDFLAEHPNVNFVVAGGNGYEARGHARVQVKAGNEGPAMYLRALPDDSTDSFAEVWLPVGIVDDVALSVRSPTGDVVKVALGEQMALRDADNDIAAAVLSTRESPNARQRGMFLLALSPTRLPNRPAGARPDPRAAAPHGVWSLTVINRTSRDFVADAWIERDDPALGDRGPRRQALFVEPAATAERGSYIKKENTLNSVATGARTVTVGGFLVRGKVFEGRNADCLQRLAPYSSAGPGAGQAARVSGQRFVAPSEASPALHGLLASGNRSGTRFRLSGTSVAAPIVTRTLLNEPIGKPRSPSPSPKGGPVAPSDLAQFGGVAPIDLRPS